MGIAPKRNRAERLRQMIKKIKQFKNLIMLSAGIVFLLIMYLNIHVVPVGYTGVFERLGQIDSRPVPNGQVTLTAPFMEHIYLVNNKQQEYETDTQIIGETRDHIAVNVKAVSVTYQINAVRSAWVCENVSDYEDSLLTDELIGSAVKTALSELSADEVMNLAKTEPLVLGRLTESLSGKYGADTVHVRKVLITRMELGKAYRAKSAALQEQARAEIANQTALAKAETDRKVALLVAETEAEKVRILARAEAEANEAIGESLNAKLIELRKIEKWDGKLPTVMGGNPSLLLGDLKK